MPSVSSSVGKGIVAGLVAGVPQVLVVQAESPLFGLPRESADIGPRFVQRVSQKTDQPLGAARFWLIAAGFHFAYAAGWGALYALLQKWRPAQPHVGGPLLASLIYALAFSPWGVATRTRTERPTDQRPLRESILHWSAALTFSVVTAVVYQRLSGEPRPVHSVSGIPG